MELSSGNLGLRLLEGRLAICWLWLESELPEWVCWRGALASVTRTSEELCVVCAEEHV